MTAVVRSCDVPPGSLLYVFKAAPTYADCYVIEVAGEINQESFVFAFYTSPLFKIERTILKYLASKPASDDDARRMATGVSSKFSAWSVEAQTPSELLLADFTGRTRSWLMAAPMKAREGITHTRLFFGSAVVPRPPRHGKLSGLGFGFHALLGFHRLYSRLLLLAASKRVGAVRRGQA